MFFIFPNAILLQDSLVSFFPYVFYLPFAQSPDVAVTDSASGAVRESSGLHSPGATPWHFSPLGTLSHRGDNVTFAVSATSKEPL